MLILFPSSPLLESCSASTQIGSFRGAGLDSNPGPSPEKIMAYE